MEMIHIAETSTDSVPNSSTTAGSCATDLNGGAVKVLYVSYTFQRKAAI